MDSSPACLLEWSLADPKQPADEVSEVIGKHFFKKKVCPNKPFEAEFTFLLMIYD